MLDAIAERNPWPAVILTGLGPPARFLQSAGGGRVLDALNLSRFHAR
jgi:hypothetical protein